MCSWQKYLRVKAFENENVRCRNNTNPLMDKSEAARFALTSW
jgi:hypothetical protein